MLNVDLLRQFPIEIAILGFRKSGKTTLITELKKYFNKLNLDVLPVKHISHKEFTIDQVSKDTWKLRSTYGIVFYVSENEFGLICSEKIEFEQLRILLRNLCQIMNKHVIIYEGFSQYVKNIQEISKILCIRDVNDLKNFNTIENIICICSYSLEIENVIKLPENIQKVFEKLDDYLSLEFEIRKVFERLPKLNCGKCGYNCFKMARLIYSGLKSFNDCQVIREHKVLLKINNQDIKLNRFVQKLLKDLIIAFVKNLKDVPDKFNTIEIRIQLY